VNNGRVSHDREIVGGAAHRSAAAAAPTPLDPQPSLERVIAEWGGRDDLWLFGYGSLIWRQEFDAAEHRPALVHGWHRALKLWSRAHRGTVHNPGLVFGLLSGGSCRGVVFRVPAAAGLEALGRLWLREMADSIYDPRWLDCRTAGGTVRALAFTLSRRSPHFAGQLDDDHYRHVFRSASGNFGTSLDYARLTLQELQRHAIHDRALARLVRLAERVEQERAPTPEPTPDAAEVALSLPPVPPRD
jgi:cation transport protein ChaC